MPEVAMRDTLHKLIWVIPAQRDATQPGTP